MAVLDASAVLALLLEEPGSELVAQHLDGASMSAANVAEVVVKHVDRGVDASEVADDLVRLGIQIEPLTAEDATAQAEIRARDRAATGGRPLLSLGDRACLALSLRLGEPALTSDRSWTDLDLPVDVLLAR